MTFQNKIKEVGTSIIDLVRTRAGIRLDNITEEGREVIRRTAGNAFQLFDVKYTDHLLEGLEAEGWELQGTYVYNTPVENVRRGYPIFYNKCIEEYKEAEVVEKYLKHHVELFGAIREYEGILTYIGEDCFAQLPQIFEPQQNEWEQVWKFRTGYDITARQHVCCFGGTTAEDNKASGVDKAPYWCIEKSQFRCAAMLKPEIILTTYTVKPQTDYVVRMKFDKAKYTFEFSENGGDFLPIGEIVDETPVLRELVPIYIGRAWQNARSAVFRGTVDLNGCYINIAGNRWWTGTDHYSYKRHNNGHCFYDISDKATIDYLYEKFGVADYYGIDEARGRILLPRNKFFLQASETTENLNAYTEAGLPDIDLLLRVDNPGAASRYNNKMEPGYGNDDLGGSMMYANADANEYMRNMKDAAPIFKAGDLKYNYHIYGNSNTVQPPASKKLLYYCVGSNNINKVPVDAVDITNSENDTIPLLFASYQPTRVSSLGWLRADGAYQSGDTYKAVYGALVDLLTNNPNQIKITRKKDMVEGKDYTDYFIVDEEAEMFVLPIRTSERVLVKSKQMTEEDPKWYNLYSDGWVEQGGYAPAPVGQPDTVVFPIQFKNVDYHIDLLAFDTSPQDNALAVMTWLEPTESTMKTWCAYNGGVTNFPYKWRVSGYAEVPKIGEYPKSVNLYYKVGNAVQHLEIIDMLHQASINNPFSLGMSSYFENAPYNSSWLKSTGQWNSKDVYIDFYTWLENIYNHVIEVEGVIVKLVTEEYSDFDFVLNPDEGTFRLPIYNGEESVMSDKYTALPLPTLKAGEVTKVGTAPANGWYRLQVAQNKDGFFDISLSCPTANSLVTCSNVTKGVTTNCMLKVCRGQDVYAWVNNTEYKVVNFVFINASGGPRNNLYYYVGDVIQNAHLVDVARIQEQMITAGDRERVLEWGCPDYSSGITMNRNAFQNFRAPAAGVILGYANPVNSGIAYIYVNGAIVWGGNTYIGAVDIRVSKGDYIRWTGIEGDGYDNTRLIYYPLKGNKDNA